MSTFGPGQSFTQTVVLSEPPDVVTSRMFMAMSGLQGTTPIQIAPGRIVVTRRFIPTWAIALAIVGFFLFLLGLAFLLVRDTETLDITVIQNPEGAGTRVTVSGVADKEMIGRLHSVFLPGQPVTAQK